MILVVVGAIGVETTTAISRGRDLAGQTESAGGGARKGGFIKNQFQSRSMAEAGQGQ